MQSCRKLTGNDASIVFTGCSVTDATQRQRRRAGVAGRWR